MIRDREYIRRRRGAGVAKALVACTACACALLCSSPVWSVTTCTVSATALAFGAYDTLTALPGTSPITLTCTRTAAATQTVSYTIRLSSGPGSYAARQMTITGDTLLYNIYTTAANTTVWGDGTAGTGVVAGSLTIPGNPSPKSASKIETVYGLINAPQNVTPGAYSTVSNLTVTVTY